jgi:apolipoprotein N-acyltransferase
MVILKAVAGGIALYFSFAPFNFWPTAVISTGLFFSALLELGPKMRFLSSFIFGIAFFLPLLHWSSTYVGAIPWLILAIGQSTLFSLIAFLPYRRNLSSAITFAAAFTLIEIFRMKFPFGGFGWGRVGHTQTDSMSAVYPVVGISGITFIIVLLGAMISIFNIRAVIVSLIAIFLLSLIPINVKASISIDLVGVQGGVDKLGLDFNDRAFSVLQRHIDVTQIINNAPDLIIWPENSSDIDPIRNQKANQLINNLIAKKQIPILVGAVEQDLRGPINSSILFDDSGNVQSRYVKQDLAPFGEFIPLRQIAEYISPQAKRVRNFVSGETWVTHDVAGTKLLPVICFELLDDDHLRSGVKLADIIVNQTNNATFGKSNQAAQQLQIARARSAEFSKETFAVSTTGFTAHISNKGEILQKLPQFQSEYLEATVNGYGGQTIASRLSSWIWVGFLSLLIVLTRLRHSR